MIASAIPSIVTNSIWVPAGAWTPGSNAPSAGLKTNANASVTDYYGFDDTTLETISTTYAPGKSFGGYFKCLIAWETATPLTSASNITWSVAVNPIALGEGFGTFPANYITNWSSPAAFSYTSNKVYWTTNMPQLLITNLTPNLVLDIRINRETNYVNKLQGDAKFIGALLYTTRTNWMGGYPSD